MSESYQDRMIRPPAGVAPLGGFVREGNRLIPQSALVTARIEVSRVDAAQCGRCRRYVVKGGGDVCPRCAGVLDGAEARR